MSPASPSVATPLNSPLPTLLQSRRRQQARVSFEATEDWGQGRTLFGGLLSVLAVQGMRDVCGADWPLRALQTNFTGPVAPGVVHVDVTLLRQGKNVRQVKAQVVQADAQGAEQVCGVLLGVFGSARSSTLPSRRPAQPEVPASGAVSLPLPFLPGLTPNFTQHLELRLAEGAFPFSGGGQWLTRYHLRIRQALGVDTELQTIMLADAGPSPSLSVTTNFAPASSVSWALELRPVGPVAPEGLWRLDQDTVAYDEGYANDRAQLWTPDGELAALGYQVVAVYA